MTKQPKLAFLVILLYLLCSNFNLLFAQSRVNNISSFQKIATDSSQNFYHNQIKQQLPGWLKRRNPFINSSGINNLAIGNTKNTSSSKKNSQLLGSNPVACLDTTQRLLMEADTTYTFPADITKTADGNILIPCTYRSRAANYLMPLLVKCTPAGTILWVKSYYGLGIYPSNDAEAYIVKETKNGDIIMGGQLFIANTGNGRYDVAIWRLDKNGNVIWAHSYESSTWTDTTSGQSTIRAIGEDDAGNLYFSGEQYIYSNPPIWLYALKLDGTGNYQWDKNFQVAGATPVNYGLVLQNNKLLLLGSFEDLYIPYSSIPVPTDILYCIYMNTATGDTMNTRAWYPDYGINTFLHTASPQSRITLLNNGNISVCATSNMDFLTYGNGLPEDTIEHCFVATFSPDFNFLSGIAINSYHASNYYNTGVTQDPNGRISYTRFLGYIDENDEDIIYGDIQNNQIIKERIYHERGRSIGSESNVLFYAPNEDVLTQSYGDNTTNTSGIELIRMHDSDTSGYCTGTDTSLSFILRYKMAPVPFINFTTTLSNSFSESHRGFANASDANLTQITGCEEIATCDSLKLYSAHDTACAYTVLNFHYYKNPGCGSRATWYFDTSAVTAYSFPDDSSLSVTYNGAWQGYVYAKMNSSCGNILSDSIRVMIISAPGPVYLGADTAICKANTLTLHAGSNYLSYLWQDGTTDSVYAVTKPGTYYVAVSDYCNNIFKDTVNVTLQQYNFSIGNDTSICSSSTLTVSATGGFNNYQWLPSYNITISSTDSAAIVFPAADTSYIVTAQKSGCFVSDTIHISVVQAPPVYLGNDTSFCSGDSIILNAGSGFINYLWNTGSVNPSIIVARAGSYSVIATNINQCKSYDTLQVIQVFTNPVINILYDSLLCTGASEILDAGNTYKNYVWQDGSTGQSITVSSPGMYWVNVADMNGCKGNDTAIITRLLNLPTDFLPGDTTVCNYPPLVLKPSQQYNNYLWSTGDISPSIIVKNAGLYLLQVTDQYGCTGNDSINVTLKQCLYGAYFADAFTPDNNGHNDTYKPIMLGNVIKYHFSIYNRYGQLMFESYQPGTGWNGFLSGTPQDSGTYVWYCTYQFAGDTLKQQKGTVVLIR